MSDTQAQDDIIDIEPKIINEGPAAPAPKKRRAWLRFVPPVIFALFAAVGGGWFYRDVLAGYLPSEQVQALSKHVSSLEAMAKDNQKRIDAVVALTEEFKTKLSATQASAEKSAKANADANLGLQAHGAEVAALKQELQSLSSSVSDVAAKVGASGSSAAVDPALVQRLDLLEKQVAAAPAAAPTVPDLTAGLKDLKSQIALGKPFAIALAPLARALPAAPGLDVLGAERAGLASKPDLAKEVESLQATLPKPVNAQEDSGLWADVKGVFSKLVKVRGQDADDLATAAAKASAFASAGDMEQAASQFKAVKNAPPLLQAWAEKAQRRAVLDRGFDAFSAALVRAGLAREE